MKSITFIFAICLVTIFSNVNAFTPPHLNTNECNLYKRDSLTDSFLPIPKVALWGSADWKLLSNDPVLFKMNCSKMGVGIGEEFEITIRVEWSYVIPAMMFTFDGSNSYTLKLLKPSGFVQTGGDFEEYLRGSVDENQPSKTYTIKGYFENVEEGTIPVFSLLRGHSKADNSSVFAKKASIEVPTQLNKLYFARKAEENPLDEQLTTINQRLQNLVMAVNSPTLGDGTFAIITPCPKRGEPVEFKVALGNTGTTPINLYVYSCYRNCTKISEHTFTVPAQTTSKYFTFSETLEPSATREFIHTHVHTTPIPTGTTEVCKNSIATHNEIPITDIFKSINFRGTQKTTTAGVPVTLQVSGCINDQNVRWQDGTVGNSLIVTPATAGTYTYTATCTDGSCTYTAISTLSVEGTGCTPPSSPPVVVSNKTGIVFGEIATLSASNCSGTVQWFGTGITGDVTGASYSTSVAGTFYAKCTNACGTSGNSLTKTISLVPLSISSDKNQAFYTEEIHLTAYGCNGYVQWQDPQGNFRSIVNNENNTFVGPGTYKARCVDNFGNIGAWVSISIATVTAPTPTIVANKYSAYPSESIVLTATGCSPYIYNWSFEGGSFFGPTQTVTGPGNYSVRCFHDDNTPSSPFVTITINETRLGTPSITASQLSAAANESVQLTSIGCTGESVINRWAINQNGTISYAWGNNFTITGAATVVANCVSGNTISPSAEVVIRAKPPGATLLTASKSSACEGEPVSFVAQGCENGSVTWRKGLTVYLNDLTPTFTEGSYPISNKSFGGNPLKIGAETFDKGLGVKALSRIRYDLQGRYSKFKASIGRDIETATLCGTDVSVRFKVNVYSGTTVTTLLNVVMTASSPAQNIDLTVTGKSTLELIVEPEGSNCGDHADWGMLV
jgi:NPCBM/NEW2 domain